MQEHPDNFREGEECNIMFLLRNDITKDSLYCRDLSKFILVPYFVKQKQLYKNKTLVYIGGDIYHNITFWKDIKTDKEVKIYLNSKWFCTDVTLLEPSYKIFYILKNDLGETIAIPSSGCSYSHTFQNFNEDFITKEEYDKKELDKKIKKEELIANKKKEEFKNNEIKEKHKAKCINKFGEYYGSLIAQGEVKIGMTEEMCKDSWGLPIDTIKTTTSNEITEYWYYGWKYCLLFKNNILIEITN